MAISTWRISSILLLLMHVFCFTSQKTSAITEAEALLKWKNSFSSSYKHPLSSPTSSVSVTETVNGSHQLVIQGYSLVKGIGVGKHIASENFTVGGYQWAIYFYPDGKNMEDYSTYVSVFIVLASEGTDVRALFELTLVDQSGKGKHEVHTHFNGSLESGPYSLKSRGSMWGYKRFFSRAMLEETSDYVKDDCLIINCRVGVVVSAMDFSRPPSLKVPDSDIGAHFGVLLENQQGSDVVFHVSGETFHAHKLVLAARSPVLRSVFFDNSDDRKELIVYDMDPKVFKAMLHFIYRDAVVEDELLITPPISEAEAEASPCSLTDSLTAKLLAAADRYGLGRLKSICECYLFKEISVNSVSQILAIAERYNAAELKAVCIRFASENLSGSDGPSQAGYDKELTYLSYS